MVDDEKHKTESKWSKKDYMREYMRERRKKARQQPAPTPPELHGPPTPPNLPRTDSPKAILQAHLNHVLNLWAETGKELATLKDADEMLLIIDSLTLENKNLQVEVENLREALKTCQGKPQEPETQVLKPQEPLPQETLPTTTKPPEPGLVDPDRRPKSADDPKPGWFG